MTPLDRCATPKRRNLMWRWDGENGEHILVGVPKTRSAHMLNPIGAQIFALCDGQTQVGSIIERLQERFPESAARVPDDVDVFLHYLMQLEIVDVVTEEGR
jgi:hypothetical protein